MYNLPPEVDSIFLPQTTSISPTSVASPNTVRSSVTLVDSSLTFDVDNDMNIASVEMKDAVNDTPAPREQTSVHVDDINPQETESMKLGTPRRIKILFYMMKTQALRIPRVLIAFDDADSGQGDTEAGVAGRTRPITPRASLCMRTPLDRYA